MKLNLILFFIFQSIVCFGQWTNYSNTNINDNEYKVSLIADGSTYSIRNNNNQYKIQKITSCKNVNDTTTNHIIYSSGINACAANKLKVQMSPDGNFIIIKTPNAINNEDKIINIYLRPEEYERVSDGRWFDNPRNTKDIKWFNSRPSS